MEVAWIKRDGGPRRVGVELELGGLDLEEIVRRVRGVVGGEVERTSRYAVKLRETAVGDVKVELDAVLFTEFKLRGFLEGLQLNKLKADLDDTVERILATEARRFVPFEVVFSPLEVGRLPELEAVRAALAPESEGTGASVYNAFGLHFNPELPAVEAGWILRYLRAFLSLYGELRRAHGVDAARRISPFIDPFPKKYVRRVLDADYAPSMTELIDDYLAENPTRNRPLDLLPIFAEVDYARVRAALPKEKISARPTLHYRLPDCRIDDPAWTLGREWAVWCRVEALAADEAELARAVKRERFRLRHPWRARLRAWLARWRGGRMRARRPVIGITGPARGGFPAWVCTAWAVWRAGGRPRRLRPGRFGEGTPLPPLQGLILGGGADIEPTRAGIPLREIFAQPDKPPREEKQRRAAFLLAPFFFLFRRFFSLSAPGTDLARDAFEERCLRAALEKDWPVLGICRGAQYINVHFGGSLHGELHGFYGERGNPDSLKPRKRIEVAEGSRLRDMLGRATTRVNSLHKQAVDRLGEGVAVAARDEAGVVQAIEVPAAGFVLGVQWHPEYLPTLAVQRRIFEHLVKAARA
ncbi:MAG: amidoligase family protein [Opitutales bacterium]|nr:amidoligase family protein [Opitutales bacterium]